MTDRNWDRLRRERPGAAVDEPVLGSDEPAPKPDTDDVEFVPRNQRTTKPINPWERGREM